MLRHAVPKGWPFYGAPPPGTPVVSVRRSAASSGRAGPGVGQKSAVLTADPTRDTPHTTPRPVKGETGTASVSTMGSGGPALHNGLTTFHLMLAQGVSPGWSPPGPFLSALGRSQRPSGAWGGGKIGRANGRSPLSRRSPETRSHQSEISNSHTINKIALP